MTWVPLETALWVGGLSLFATAASSALIGYMFGLVSRRYDAEGERESEESVTR